MHSSNQTMAFAPSAAVLQDLGASLPHTLYGLPVTVFLNGELGAGKTTFVQGLARGLGVEDHIVSPTYALEQRYETAHGPLLHIDLYRMTPKDAERLLDATDDHTGIRCIEWSERIDVARLKKSHRTITVALSERSGTDGRQIDIAFEDMPLPTDAQIDAWREEVLLPPHIIAHCEAVANFAVSLTEQMAARGHIIRPQALRAAGKVHDLFRFVDFKPGVMPSHATVTAEMAACWDTWKTRYPDKRHEALCALFLREKGFPELADIVEPHGFSGTPEERRTIEQKLLFYADKRVREDQVVTLDERFADFAKRYNDGKQSTEGKRWQDETVALEKQLFEG